MRVQPRAVPKWDGGVSELAITSQGTVSQINSKAPRFGLECKAEARQEDLVGL